MAPTPKNTRITITRDQLHTMEGAFQRAGLVDEFAVHTKGQINARGARDFYYVGRFVGSSCSIKIRGSEFEFGHEGRQISSATISADLSFPLSQLVKLVLSDKPRLFQSDHIPLVVVPDADEIINRAEAVAKVVVDLNGRSDQMKADPSSVLGQGLRALEYTAGLRPTINFVQGTAEGIGSPPEAGTGSWANKLVELFNVQKVRDLFNEIVTGLQPFVNRIKAEPAVQKALDYVFW
ncbi:MAG: hypothetical protein WCT31_05665 [Candidatus Micrarchaeia archaeon]